MLCVRSLTKFVRNLSFFVFFLQGFLVGCQTPLKIHDQKFEPPTESLVETHQSQAALLPDLASDERSLEKTSSTALPPPVTLPPQPSLDAAWIPRSSVPVVVVLGPGLARGFAHFGVLYALEKASIPVAAVLGTEMGALAAALYAHSQTLSQMEWSLQYFSEDCFIQKKLFFQTTQNSGDKLSQQLKKIFKDRLVQQGKVPLQFALESEWTGIPIVIRSGSLALPLRGALHTASLFSSFSLILEKEPVSVVAAHRSLPFLIKEAQALNLGKVIVVNVLKAPEAKRWSNLLSEADWIIEPDLEGFDYLHYHQKNEIFYRGKKKTLEQLEALKHHLTTFPRTEEHLP